MEEQKRAAIETGELRLPFGSKRRFPYVDDRVRSEIERQAVNTPIQGTACHICLSSGVVPLQDLLDPSKAIMQVQVHDEILMRVREDCVGETCELVKRTMESPVFPSQPLTFEVDIEVGKNWADTSKALFTENGSFLGLQSKN